jgi:hypothetical protein
MINRIFYLQMVDYSGTDGLFWYFKFNGNFVRWIFILIYDEINKNDFDSCVRSFYFKRKVCPPVLILRYNWLTHEPLMPKVCLFF